MYYWRNKTTTTKTTKPLHWTTKPLKCNNNNTLKANPDDNTLKANPAVCKHTTTTTIKTTAQIMHKSDINYNNNKDTRKMQYFAANA